ncbi:MAG TPA: STAS domain-containing protein [Spirochaetota bacterium]|nr:STAS domain-containing protein [Spirochaetota bacterium]HPI89045.1 STAS domain-containing protein [Spirochaetota bacterium]HPR48662.1 STAS domain-containing protein [Spirochaetota bacterium]
MNILMEIKQDVSVLYPPKNFGEACFHSLQTRIEYILNMSETCMLIDFSEVARISSVILGCLVRAARDFSREGRRVALCSVNGSIHKIFDLFESDEIEIYESQEEALEFLEAVKCSGVLYIR